MRGRTAQSGERPDVSVGAGSVVPRGVARAVQFMRDNLTAPLNLGVVAAAAGMPERTLRRQFRRFTGQSPVAFHRNLRLEAARRALHDGTNVTAAAGARGFSHFSHFTAQYRRRFGELPSETLQTARVTVVQLPPREVRSSVTLAILPFTAATAEEAALAAATTERLMSALGRARWLNVSGSRDDAPPAGRIESSAQYAVRGRVHSIGGGVQVAVRLVEVSTGRHIWGNAFEGRPESAAELQERVAQGAASFIVPCLREAESIRAGQGVERDPVAVDCVRRAFRAVFEIAQSASDQALENLDIAQSIDPEFPLARAVAAWCHALRATCFFGDADIDREKARHLTALALSMDNEDPLVLAALGNAATIFGDLDLGEVLVNKCLAIDPDCMMAWQRRGWIANYRGRDTAVADFRRALALTPGASGRFNTILGMSWAYVLAGNYAAAAEWAVQGIRERPSEAWACRIAAVAQVRCGQMREARRSVARLLRQYPDMTVGKIVDALPNPPEIGAFMADALESAGLPV